MPALVAVVILVRLLQDLHLLPHRCSRCRRLTLVEHWLRPAGGGPALPTCKPTPMEVVITGTADLDGEHVPRAEISKAAWLHGLVFSACLLVLLAALALAVFALTRWALS